MLRYLLLFPLFIFSFTSCTKDTEPLPGQEQNEGEPDPGSGGGNSTPDPNCNAPSGPDFNLELSFNDYEFTSNYKIFIMDQNWEIVVEGILQNGDNFQWTQPGAAEQSFNLMILEYFQNSNSSFFDAQLILDIPAGTYDITKQLPVNSPDSNLAKTVVTQTGPLPFAIKSNNTTASSKFWDPQNGGTYNLWRDYNNASINYPEHNGYFLSFQSSMDDQIRYYWNENPPTGNQNPAFLNYNQLPVAETIQVNLAPEIANADTYNYSIYGFVPENTSPRNGNMISNHFDYHSLDRTYGVPNNIFNRYQLRLNYRRTNPFANYSMQVNSSTPISEISGSNLRFNLTSNDVTNFSGTSTGNYDAYIVYYYFFKEIGSSGTLYNLAVHGAPENNSIEFSFPQKTIDYIFEDFCFGCMNYSGVQLINYPVAQCYSSFLKYHLVDDNRSPNVNKNIEYEMYNGGG